MVDDVIEECAKEKENEDTSEEVVCNGDLARGSEELTATYENLKELDGFEWHTLISFTVFIERMMGR